eukprot:CAMPEP_0113605790 /NCGR_PEP_ID=MMETSP0017_2-20120614/2516_1 /TAXON_ID=2856 /ORGANISM="Cylindrotheca closterium" /LENGTH=622 /DNA_ID=CAMNT_0000514305 /DNA_START=23 /DNA_END=1891 /DNA_ORIENTATION=- /assembly_acc=CAM_ASM_000147
MSHALDVLSLEFFQLYDSLAEDASRVEESTTALERARSERDATQSELAMQQNDLQKIRALIKEQQDRIHLITTHWFYGTTLFQPQLWLRGGCTGKKRRAEKKLNVATNEKLPASVASVNESEARLSQKLRIVEEQLRFFEVAANAASEREGMKARAVIENPSNEIRRLQREEAVSISRLKHSKTELESLDTVAVKIGGRQKEHNEAIKFLKKALTHRDRHDVLKNNPVELPRPIDVLRNTEQHETSSEAWLPNGTKSVLIRTKHDHQKHLFRVDKHNRLLMTNSPCPNDCGFLVTWNGTYCCNACASGTGCHGRRCERMPIKSQEGAKAKLSTWKAEQKKRDKDMNAELTSCNQNLEMAKKCMQAADQLGAEALVSIASSVLERHPGSGNSFRHMDHIIATSLRGGCGCSQVESIHQEIAGVERAQGTLTEQVSIVEHLVRLVKDDVERLEQGLLTVQSLEEEESNQIFRRLREQVCCSTASAPPPMNPSFINSEYMATGLQTTAAVPSAPMEEDILVSNVETSSEFTEPRLVEPMPPAATIIETCTVPPRDTRQAMQASHHSQPSTMSRTSYENVPASAPEATIIGASSVPAQQDAIPMVSATLVSATLVPEAETMQLFSC